MLKSSVFEFPANSVEFIPGQPLAFEVTGELPDVPALPETLIALELQLGEWPVQLGEIADSVLGDMGATIQVLRLAGREHGSSEYRPIRIEDCICDLGAKECLAGVARGSLRRGARRQEVLDAWTHAREIAHVCRMLAEDSPGSIKPYEAYLAGLLHEMGSLPELLGWDLNDLPSNPELRALRLAERWEFPRFLRDAFRENTRPGRHAHWSKLIRDAHELVGGLEMHTALIRIPAQMPA